eukprot:546707-Pyramimonas_sp.AAC.2
MEISKRRISTYVNVVASIVKTLIRASDVAGDVWHLWLESEGKKEVAPRGLAAAVCKDRSSVHQWDARIDHSRRGLWTQSRRGEI